MAKAIEYTCKVKSTQMLTPTVFEIQFEPDSELDFLAGQFISVIVPGAGPNGRDLRRAYSIASEPEARPVELCIKYVEGGPGTTYLKSLKADDTFKGLAPYGAFTYKTPSSRHACFISTGTGIAPFRSMIRSESFRNDPPQSATCLLGVRHEEELLYQDEFNAIDVQWVEAVSRPKGDEFSGLRGRVTDYFRNLPDDYPWRETDYYLCGNGDMIKEIKSILTEKGVEKTAIHQEKYY